MIISILILLIPVFGILLFLRGAAYECADYDRYGTKTHACAVCGDFICSAYEGCTASYVGMTPVRPGGTLEPFMVTTQDCGPLYCPQDCGRR